MLNRRVLQFRDPPAHILKRRAPVWSGFPDSPIPILESRESSKVPQFRDPPEHILKCRAPDGSGFPDPPIPTRGRRGIGESQRQCHGESGQRRLRSKGGLQDSGAALGRVRSSRVHRQCPADLFVAQRLRSSVLFYQILFRTGNKIDESQQENIYTSSSSRLSCPASSAARRPT